MSKLAVAFLTVVASASSSAQPGRSNVSVHSYGNQPAVETQFNRPDRRALVAEVAVPFKLIESRIYVDAFVNGSGPLRFLVDTGADGMGRADSALVKELALPVTGTTENSDGLNSSMILTVRAESLRLGNFERRNVELPSRDYNRRASPETSIAGIIGREFFEDGTLTIDFPARVLKFSRTRRLKPTDKDVVAYEEPIVIPLAIGRRKFKGHIDTGSTLTMHLPMSDLRRVKASPLEDAGTGHRANTVLRLFRTTLQEPVRISGLKLDRLTVITSKEANWINIGGGVLQQGVLMLDQSRKLFALRPSGSPKSPQRN
jgi:hypothetical protein